MIHWPHKNPCIPNEYVSQIKNYYTSNTPLSGCLVDIFHRGLKGDKKRFSKEKESQISYHEKIFIPKADIYFIDKNVFSKWGDSFTKINNYILFDATEENKSINELLKMEEALTDSKSVCAVGGGVTLDMVGFLCALRNLPLSYVPTTLLSMVDVCVGGKTGCNILPYGKNQIGAFYLPDEVHISKEWLDTLDPLEFKSGLNECLKHAIISQNQNLFTQLNKKTINIKDFVEVKSHVIRNDLFENDQRKVLNIGHTVGHAIEVLDGLKHGIAIGLGLQIESSYLRESGHKSYHVGNFEFLTPDHVYFKDQNIHTWCERIWKIMINDKKNIKDHVIFSTLDAPYLHEINFDTFKNHIERLYFPPT